MTGFGKFPSLEAFVVACEGDRADRAQHRDVVEVDCKIAVVEPVDTKGVKHARIDVELTEVLSADPDVDGDVESHLASHARVLVAIQFGGSRGEIPGLVEGADIRVRGVWVTAERAYAAGGDKLAVLHFTHAPVGFVVVGGTVYK
jgi:endonuclease G